MSSEALHAPFRNLKSSNVLLTKEGLKAKVDGVAMIEGRLPSSSPECNLAYAAPELKGLKCTSRVFLLALNFFVCPVKSNFCADRRSEYVTHDVRLHLEGESLQTGDFGASRLDTQLWVPEKVEGLYQII